jgi:OmpA-OmpF porin, OOP family
MVKSLLISASLALFYSFAHSQEQAHKQPNTLGIHFVFNDFETARAIRTSSLSSAFKNKKFGKLKDMRQGFALSYGNGLSENWDFSSMITGSFLYYPMDNRATSGSEHLLLEMDASVKGKCSAINIGLFLMCRSAPGSQNMKGTGALSFLPE